MSLNTYPYNPFPASTDKLDEAHNAELQQEVDQLKEDTGELQEDVEKLETDKTDTAVIAPEFDAEAGVYAVGDLVIYQGKLYEFTTAHETAGDWDPTEVTEKTVADELSSLESGLTNAENSITTLNSHRIELYTFNTLQNAQTVSFAGTAHTRCANMILLPATQGAVYEPIVVGFEGANIGLNTILAVSVSQNNLGITASGLDISIPADLASYGTHTLVKLYPDDDITVTITQVT